jgi:hypothetical protein
MSADPPAATLLTAPRLADPDAAFRMLTVAHRGLSETDAAALNARLVLILANHIGDAAVLAAAIKLAQGAGSGAAPD